VINYL